MSKAIPRKNRRPSAVTPGMKVFHTIALFEIRTGGMDYMWELGEHRSDNEAKGALASKILGYPDRMLVRMESVELTGVTLARVAAGDGPEAGALAAAALATTNVDHPTLQPPTEQPIEIDWDKAGGGHDAG